jgi:hypothetical protein
LIKSTLSNDFECIFLELNFKNSKWLLFEAYKPPSQCSNFFFSEVTKAITKLNSKYDNLLLLGDFNESVKDRILRNFMDDNTPKCLIKEPTCYKNPNNPSYIDLILTNQSRKFKNSCVHKHRRPEDFDRFRKHRNYVDRLYKRERRDYFNRLKKNDIEDIKCFWKTVKPLLSEKGNVKNEIKIVKDNVIIDDNKAVAEEFNSKFTNVVQELNIDFNWNTDVNIESINV